MDRPPKPDIAWTDLHASTDFELVALLIRGEERMEVQARKRPAGIEYWFHLREDAEGVPQTVQQQSFTDDAEAEAYLHAELTRLVGEGWQRDRPELGV